MIDYDEITELWEASVRSTHHFVTEEDILFYKPLVRNHFLQAVDLYVERNAENRVVAFMGLSETLIEMLFVHPDEQGKGYGKRLLEFAVREKGIRKIDVNEQNERAFQFYKNRGFEVYARDEKDSMGKPLPILHMRLRFYEVREAKEEDLSAIIRLFHQTVEQVNSRDYDVAQIEAWQRKASPKRWEELWNSDLVFYVADSAEFGLVGFASVNSEGYIHSMFTDSRFQGCGIASALLREVEAFARRAGALSCTSEVSITARPFFERNGYKTIEKQTVSIGEVSLTNFKMICQLTE